MTADEIKATRDRLLQFISPEVAAVAGLGHDTMRLQQAAIGCLPLTDPQWSALARRMSMPFAVPVRPL